MGGRIRDMGDANCATWVAWEFRFFFKNLK
jgi:hypothetical protein